MKNHVYPALISVLILGAACLSEKQQEFKPVLSAAQVYQDVLIKEVPHVKQKPDFCGEACAEMFLKKLDLFWKRWG